MTIYRRENPIPGKVYRYGNDMVPVEIDTLPNEVIQAGADALEIWSEQDFTEPAVRWSAAVEVLAAALGAGIGDNEPKPTPKEPGTWPMSSQWGPS